MEIPHPAYDAFFKEHPLKVAPTLTSILESTTIARVREPKTDLAHGPLNGHSDFVFEVTTERGERVGVKMKERTGNDAELGDVLCMGGGNNGLRILRAPTQGLFTTQSSYLPRRHRRRRRTRPWSSRSVPK